MEEREKDAFSASLVTDLRKICLWFDLNPCATRLISRLSLFVFLASFSVSKMLVQFGENGLTRNGECDLIDDITRGIFFKKILEN